MADMGKSGKRRYLVYHLKTGEWRSCTWGSNALPSDSQIEYPIWDVPASNASAARQQIINLHSGRAQQR